MKPAATLKALRLEAGLTQQQLADKAGLDRSWVNQMERGKKKITQAPRQKLADALGVSPIELGAAPESDPEAYQSLEDRLGSLEANIAANHDEMMKNQKLGLKTQEELRDELRSIHEALDTLLGDARTQPKQTQAKQ